MLLAGSATADIGHTNYETALAHTSPQLVDPAPSSLALKGKQEFLSDKSGLPLRP